MPVQIGSRTHSFSDPTGLLSDCHRRVEMFLGSLQTVADTSGLELTQETCHSLDLALRYFREAAPKHTADEEESVFPRLRKVLNPELQLALQQLDVLEADHRWAEPLHASVEQLGKHYLAAGHLSPEDAHVFRNAIDDLREMYRRHIEVEDRDVFPVANRILTGELKAEIAHEMAARRDAKVFSAL